MCEVIAMLEYIENYADRKWMHEILLRAGGEGMQIILRNRSTWKSVLLGMKRYNHAERVAYVERYLMTRLTRGSGKKTNKKYL